MGRGLFTLIKIQKYLMKSYKKIATSHSKVIHEDQVEFILEIRFKAAIIKIQAYHIEIHFKILIIK